VDERVRPVALDTASPASSPSIASRPALEARGIYKVFVPRGGAHVRPMTALRDVSLDVRPGEFLSLIGPSGCGKSTVLNMFAGLTPPTEGTILHDGRAVEGVNTRVGYVTQDDNLLPWRTTLANVEIALELKQVPREARRARALAYLARVGLAGFEHHYPHELSGGMRKRVSIVRTLVDESVNVILMDEPLGPLDAQTRLLLQDELLQLWQGSGRTILFVTHDLVEAIALSDRIAIFTSAPGRIKEIREVRIPRPRDVFHIHEAPGFADIYDAIWKDLRDEIRKAREGARVPGA
jgi:NitT/TauT family transport system ATP-binding protein